MEEFLRGSDGRDRFLPSLRDCVIVAISDPSAEALGYFRQLDPVALQERAKDFFRLEELAGNLAGNLPPSNQGCL